MSNFNWCHGPECHTYTTQDRIRGIKGHKVLRTKKVKLSSGRSMFGNGGGNVWDYFCNHRCLMDFVAKHTQALANIALVRFIKLSVSIFSKDLYLHLLQPMQS